MEKFCKNNALTIKHGATRTAETQGLIERSKEDMHTSQQGDSSLCIIITLRQSTFETTKSAK